MTEVASRKSQSRYTFTILGALEDTNKEAANDRIGRAVMQIEKEHNIEIHSFEIIGAAKAS